MCCITDTTTGTHARHNVRKQNKNGISVIGRAIIFKIEVIFVFVIIGYAVFRLMMIRLFLLYSQVGYLLGSEVIGAKHFVDVVSVDEFFAQTEHCDAD